MQRRFHRDLSLSNGSVVSIFLKRKKMVKLERSDVVARLIRRDDLSELGVPTWTIIKNAIREKRRDEAIDFLRYLPREVGQRVTGHINFINRVLTYIAETHGEKEVAKALRWWRNALKQAGRLDFIYSLGIEELIQYQAEEIRASLGLGGRRCFSITEEADKFVLCVHPHIGRLRRMNQRGILSPPLGVTKKPHPWTWGKAEVPYYCAYCCLWWEIIPIEERGYPVRIHEFPENPEEPCRILYYKKPELIPGEFFSRVGLEKDWQKLSKVLL
jgi:hypothetical protein